MKELRFSYKTMWYNPAKKQNELSTYSSTFKTKELALEWYNNFGKKLENIFNRKLVLKINEV